MTNAAAVMLLLYLVGTATGDGGVAGGGGQGAGPAAKTAAMLSPPQSAGEQAGGRGRFTIFGTWNALDAVVALIRQYEQGQQSHVVDYTPIVSEQIPGCLARHECDVGVAMDSFAPSAGKMASHLGGNFVAARFVLVVAVNGKSSLRAISMRNLQAAFAVNLLNPATWKDISGSGIAGKIEIYHPQCLGPDWLYFQKKVLLGGPYSDDVDHSVRDRHQKGSDAEIIAAISKHENAIGFFRYRSDKKADKRIRILGIATGKDAAPVFPSPSTLADGSYPLADTLSLYLHRDAPPEARDFCKLATGPEAAKIISGFGLWPEYELNEVRARERLADVKTGRGTEIVACDLTGRGNVLTDLSLEFVKAKAAVQVKFQKGEMLDDARECLAEGTTELLLADGSSGQSPVVGGQNGANPKSRSEKPKAVVLGRMEVGIIVHPENPLASLPLDEARSIFCGEVKKWPAVRGAAAAMHVFGLKRGDPIAQLLKEKLAESGGRKPLKYTAQPDTEKVILTVARDPAAIGFVDLNQLPPGEKSVKLVPVLEGRGSQGDSPSFVGRNLGQSPPNSLSRTLTLYVSPKAGQAAKDFAAFLTPEHCKETIARHNLLPPLPAEQPELASRPPFGPLPADAPPADADGPVARAVGLVPVLDDPDAPQGQGVKNAARVKGRKLAAKPEPVMPEPEQPAMPEVAADSQPTSKTESGPKPTRNRGTPALTENQALWLAGGGVVGGILLAIGVGWWGSPRRKQRPKVDLHL
jgi:ABC-type phosphate transport system substrate-binding protein